MIIMIIIIVKMLGYPGEDPDTDYDLLGHLLPPPVVNPPSRCTKKEKIIFRNLLFYNEEYSWAFSVFSSFRSFIVNDSFRSFFCS